LLYKNSDIKINRPIILPDILFGHEIQFPTSTEEQKLRVTENRALRKMFRPK
jgi:hypothetical protein